MAKLSSKQLNTKLTGSYTFSGSSHSFTGNISADNNISASATSTGSFGYLEGATFGTTAQSNISGSFSAASASFATTTTANAARLDTVQQFSGSYATTGSNTFIGDQILSSSKIINKNFKKNIAVKNNSLIPSRFSFEEISKIFLK